MQNAIPVHNYLFSTSRINFHSEELAITQLLMDVAENQNDRGTSYAFKLYFNIFFLKIYMGLSFSLFDFNAEIS
jgi:hypothetical protein